MSSAIPRRALGRTGVQVSAIGVGGWHLSLPKVDKKLALRIVHEAYDRGITFFDNSWDYNDGESERRMGKALSDGRRQHVFLMTKIDGRTRADGRAPARRVAAPLAHRPHRSRPAPRSHSLRRPPSDLRSKRARIVRCSMRATPASSASSASPGTRTRTSTSTCSTWPRARLPLRHGADAAQRHGRALRSFGRMVLPRLVAEGIGVLGMKPLANGVILRSKTVSATECLRYALTYRRPSSSRESMRWRFWNRRARSRGPLRR